MAIKKIQLRRDAPENWSLNNPVLSEGEVGIELSNSSVKIKIGNGEKNWNDLDYFVDKELKNKQDTLISGTNIKTINGESILGNGDLVINSSAATSDFINGGVINITSTGDIESIYNSLETGGIALCIIGDSNGKYPSTETRVNVNSNYTVSTNYFFSESSRGANVGDLLMITKQNYLLIDRCALKIIPINDAKVADGSYIGTDGIMTVWDKQQVNKISGIESVANNALPKSSQLPSRWSDNMNNALQTGVYPWCTLGRPAESTGAYTCIVQRTSTNDGSYDTIEQTAYGREGELGKVYKRIIFYKSDGTDTQYGEWLEITPSLTVDGNTIIHSGNIGSQSVSYASSSGDSNKLEGQNLSSLLPKILSSRRFISDGRDIDTLIGDSSCGWWNSLDNKDYTNGPKQNFGLLSARINTDYFGQLAFGYESSNLMYRSQVFRNSSIVWGPWKTIAFTSDIPTSLPASDVYAWAKASTKPSYSWSEITEKPKISVVNNGTSNTTSSISSNTFYVWGSVSSLTITLATPSDSSIYNEYMFQFTCPSSSATTLSVPSSIKWTSTPILEKGKTYQVSIVNNLAVLGGGF